MIRFLLILSLFAAHGLNVLSAQPAASEIMAKVKKESARVRDYSVDMYIAVSMPGVSVPPMDATLFFKAPDKVRVKTEGFAMVPRDVLSVNPQTFDESQFDMVVQGEEKIGETSCYKVKLLAKSDTMRIQRATVLVDPNHWTLRRVTVDPDQGASVTIAFDHMMIENSYLLPSRAVITMETPNLGRWGKEARLNPSKEHKDGESKMTVRYSNYKVNKGISDSIFKEEAKP